MDFEKAYSVDKEAAEKGKWLTTPEGFEVKVGKLGNPEYKAEIIRLSKPHIHLINSSTDTSNLMDEITTKAMSRKILFDWKAESNGKKIPYTPELGFQYMTKSSDFKEDVSALSVDRSNFKPEEVAGK